MKGNDSRDRLGEHDHPEQNHHILLYSSFPTVLAHLFCTRRRRSRRIQWIRPAVEQKMQENSRFEQYQVEKEDQRVMFDQRVEESIASRLA